jgi:hypothetical protein
VLPPWRPAYVIAGFAGLVGIAFVGMGLWGLHKYEFIKLAMFMGHAFFNPENVNIKVDEDLAKYKILMAIFLSFGIVTLLASYGLFREKRWAQNLWLTLVAVHIIVPAQNLTKGFGEWIWITISVTVFVISFWVFHTRGWRGQVFR